MSTVSWAYEFDSSLPLLELQQRLNATGQWTWTARESAWYGDYLICRPARGVRVRIHDRDERFFGSPDREEGPRYKCQFDVTAGGGEVRSELEQAFAAMIRAVNPDGFREIETYD